MTRYVAVSQGAPSLAAPMPSANSVQLSYMSIVGAGMRGKVIIFLCTGIDRSTRRVIVSVSFQDQLTKELYMLTDKPTSLFAIACRQRLQHRAVHFREVVQINVRLDDADKCARLDT